MRHLLYFVTKICLVSCTDDLNIDKIDGNYTNLSTRAYVSDKLYYYNGEIKYDL